ncbi:MAG: CD1871A family CXXC motif-containing protein [Thermodesulfobacteriota bacterium]
MTEPVQKRINPVSFILLVFFLLIFLAGVITGEPGSVLQKAQKICLSCIGIA